MLRAAGTGGRLGTGDALPRDRAFAPDGPVPFEHVWAPLLRAARRRVRRAAGRAAYARLAGAAHAGLERGLLGRIGDLTTRTLYRAFVAMRAAHGARAYAAFVRAQLGGGLRGLLVEHPELARLLAALVADWADATVELLVRFAADAPAIADALGHGRPLGRVVRVDAGLSDPHGGGRQVAVLYPACGRPLVYKPRSLAPDAAYARLVAWLDGVLPPGVPRPRALRVLDRGTHGWMEYVAFAPCADAAAYGRYFERAGAVLCLAHVLRGGDLHSGNVVADGEHPVLVDLETLCGPVPAEGAHAGAGLEPCVLDTGLLPQVRVDGDGSGRVEAGIGVARDAGSGDAAPARVAPGWVDVNADGMRWGVRAVTPVAGAHRPRLTVRGGAPEVDVAAAVARGFRRTYETVRARRAELLADGGPLAAFAGGTSRVLLRATSVYGLLLRRTTHPPMLRDPRVRSAELDVLRRPYLRAAERPALWPALDAECEAMQRLDVPLFTVPADGTGLHAPGRGVVVPGYAECSGYAAVRRGVAGLDGGHLRRQLHHVRIAFAADAHRRAPGPAPRAEPPGGAGEVEPDAALAEAARIAALLRAVAVRQGAGRAAWFAHDMGGGQRRLGPAGHGLESGQAGVALFFAAYARVLRDRGRAAEADEAAAWARAAARPTCEMVWRRGGAGRPRGPGLAAGWGGVAYALACVGCLTNDADALAAARAALEPLGRPRPRAPADVFLGAAGAVLGALAVHRATGDGCALAVAAGWGDVLLARRWWAASDGFGHGRAGVAAALLRLAARTGDGRYAAAARTALAPPDDSHVDSPVGPGTASGTVGWCRGAPGVGLARVAALDSGMGTPAERAGWRVALADLAAGAVADDRGPWTLCCGALARVDLLLGAAAMLGRPSLVRDARALAGRVVAAAARRRSYAHPPHTEALVPGLLRGLAGTGYTLLRTAAPDVLPSVLLADVPGPLVPGR